MKPITNPSDPKPHSRNPGDVREDPAPTPGEVKERRRSPGSARPKEERPRAPRKTPIQPTATPNPGGPERGCGPKPGGSERASKGIRQRALKEDPPPSQQPPGNPGGRERGSGGNPGGRERGSGPNPGGSERAINPNPGGSARASEGAAVVRQRASKGATTKRTKEDPPSQQPPRNPGDVREDPAQPRGT
ncbi:hypothetical protein StoSoilB20_39340 [Arthrobacter sp. StoSoilB20]|nr:hypothetical protein StoSoilB20_39340 [Arthrobacter sp. StoSoilB20]